MLLLPLTYSAGKFNSFQMQMIVSNVFVCIFGATKDVLEYQTEKQEDVSSNSGSSAYSSFSSPYTNYHYDSNSQVSTVFQ